MLCVWVYGCDPGRVSDGLRLASLSSALLLSFSGMCCVLLFLFFVVFVLFLFCFVFMLLLELCRCSYDPFSYLFLVCVLCLKKNLNAPVPFFCLGFVLFLFCFVFMLLLELCRCSSDLFLSSRPRTGLATTYITGSG